MKNVSREFPGMSDVRPLVKGDSIPDFWCRKVGKQVNPEYLDISYDPPVLKQPFEPFIY